MGTDLDFTTPPNPLPKVSPLETIWASLWGPIWALHLRLCHGDHHNNIASTTTDPSQPPPPPLVWGFTATQHTHKSKPSHQPKPILRLHWSIKLHGRASELNPQNPISKHSIGWESLSKKKKKKQLGEKDQREGECESIEREREESEKNENKFFNLIILFY